MRRPVLAGVLVAVLLGIVGAVFVAFSLTGAAEPEASGTATAASDVSESDVCWVESEIYYGVEEGEIADILLRKDGISDDVRAYATAARDAANAELEDLRAWYLEWIDAKPLEYSAEGPCAGHGNEHAQMPGMPSWSQLTALSDAQGADAEALYLEINTQQVGAEIVVAELFAGEGHHDRVVESAQAAIASGRAQLEQLGRLAR